MADYAPGMRVIIRDEEWMVRKVAPNDLGNKALYAVGISPLVKDREAVFLSDLEDIQVVDPVDVTLVPDTSPYYRRTLLYLESQWRQKVPTDEALHVGHLAAMDDLPYQLVPASLALQQPRQRILIADTVGLGKTLEAGILMSELIARGKGKRILVVTSKSMMAQFQKEMWNRFTIPLMRLDSREIQKIRANLPASHNPFYFYDKTIVSVDTLKRDVEYRTHLENAYWDIIVLDEAQNVAERGRHQAQRSRLAQLLAERSDTMIMLSATPHDGRPRSFASLMNMLDPTAIADPDNYTREDIQGLFIRRFKEDIKDQFEESFPKRVVTIERCDASEAEERTYQVLADMDLKMDAGKSTAGMLFRTFLEKSLFSSPAACIKSIDERLKKLRNAYPEGFSDIDQLEELKKAAEQIDDADFSRYQHLLKLLDAEEYGWNSDDPEDRIVIFTERIETMKYLAKHLRTDLEIPDSAVQELSGSMSDVEQQRIVEEFGRTEAPVRILVASDVASEGLNLHYCCHRMIHFDIPWSLMVFQQRNGRIDRYGQYQQPDIRYMLIQSRNEKIGGDMRILQILVDKEEKAGGSIGDPPALLQLYNVPDEEAAVARAMQTPGGEDALTDELDQGEKKCREQASGQTIDLTGPAPETTEDRTIFSDLDYLRYALEFLNRDESHPFEEMRSVSGLRVKLTPEMSRRLRAVIPVEAMPKGSESLTLSTDRKFCLSEMADSMKKNLDENVWPSTQYLWRLHPVLSWVNDRCSLLFKRGEVPVMGLKKKLKPGETVFICAGSYFNKRSVPVIDEWFAVNCRNGRITIGGNMTTVVWNAGLSSVNTPNAGLVTGEDLAAAKALLPEAVSKAREYMDGLYQVRTADLYSRLDEQRDKLTALKERHMGYQNSIHKSSTRKNEEALRRVEKMFSDFESWTEESYTLENNPYIRIVAVLRGVKP